MRNATRTDLPTPDNNMHVKYNVMYTTNKNNVRRFHRLEIAGANGEEILLTGNSCVLMSSADPTESHIVYVVDARDLRPVPNNSRPLDDRQKKREHVKGNWTVRVLDLSKNDQSCAHVALPHSAYPIRVRTAGGHTTVIQYDPNLGLFKIVGAANPQLLWNGAGYLLRGRESDRIVQATVAEPPKRTATPADAVDNNGKVSVGVPIDGRIVVTAEMLQAMSKEALIGFIRSRGCVSVIVV